MQEVQTSSSPTLQQRSLKPELTHFTPLTDVTICSVISHKSSELYLASAMPKTTQSNPGKGHRLAPTSRGKVLLPILETFPHRPLFVLNHWKILVAALGPCEILHYIRAWVSNTPYSFQGKKHVLPTSPSNVLG